MKRPMRCLTLLAVILLCSLLAFSGCTYSIDTGRYGNYFDGEKVFMKPGETCELDIGQIFSNFPNLKSYKLKSSDTNVASVRGNKIYARSVGKATIWISLKSTGNIMADSFVPYVTNESCAATVFVTDEDKMTGIYTAQDLDNIRNDLSGFYVLKNDIDLADWGNWQPIGGAWTEDGKWDFSSFTGILINPHGYRIKNLTVDFPPGDAGTFDPALSNAGFFGDVFTAYIDGIILENVRISAMHSNTSRAGGIAAEAMYSVIKNCKVSGEITARDFAGGIAGYCDSYIFDCQFAGKVHTPEYPGLDRGYGYAGGIVGCFRPQVSLSTPYYGDVKNCSAIGEIASWKAAGGICGYATPFREYHGLFFSGTLTGINTGHFIGENEEILGI